MKKKHILLTSILLSAVGIATVSLVTYSCTKKSEDTPVTPPGEDPEEKECKHEYSDYIITMPSTCSNEGVKTRSCKKCKKTQTEIISIDQNNHDFGEAIITKRATCLEEGEAIHYCNHNSNHVLKETLEKIPHIFSDKIEEVSPTYRKDGIKSHYHCLICENDFANDMTTILSKEDLRIPKLDSTNIDKLENRIHYLMASNQDLKEYHKDVIDDIYKEYNSLSKEEREQVECDKYESTDKSYKAVLDDISNNFDVKYPTIKKIHDSHNDSISMYLNGVLNETYKNNVIDNDFGFVNSFKFKDDFNGEITFYIKPINSYSDYFKKGGKLYFYSPIEADLEISNSIDNVVRSSIKLIKDNLNIIDINADALLPILDNNDSGNIKLDIKNVEVSKNESFKFTSIFSNYFTVDELTSLISTYSLESGYSNKKIDEIIKMINQSSPEFKSSPIVANHVKQLNENKEFISNKYSSYLSTFDLRNYNYYSEAYDLTSTVIDDEFDNCHKFKVSDSKNTLNARLKATFQYVSGDYIGNKGIEFYVKGDFTNFTGVTIRGDGVSLSIKTKELIKPNILKVNLGPYATYEYISLYELTSKITEITLKGLAPSEYRLSQFYFFDASL